jgi:hypothetical protein
VKRRSVLGGGLAQMSMFFPKERRMGKLVPLYIGSKDGFSMGMFESKVLKYPGTQISWDVRQSQHNWVDALLVLMPKCRIQLPGSRVRVKLWIGLFAV